MRKDLLAKVQRGLLKKYFTNLLCMKVRHLVQKKSNLNRIFLLCLLWCNPPAWVHLNADSHLSYHPIHRHTGPIYFEVYFLLDVCNAWNKWLFFQIWKILVLDMILKLHHRRLINYLFYRNIFSSIHPTF